MTLPNLSRYMYIPSNKKIYNLITMEYVNIYVSENEEYCYLIDNYNIKKKNYIKQIAELDFEIFYERIHEQQYGKCDAYKPIPITEQLMDYYYSKTIPDLYL